MTRLFQENIPQADLLWLILVSMLKGAVVVFPLIAAIHFIGDTQKIIVFIASSTIMCTLVVLTVDKSLITSVDLIPLIIMCTVCYGVGIFSAYYLASVAMITYTLAVAVSPYSILAFSVFAWVFYNKGVDNLLETSATFGIITGCVMKIIGIVLFILCDTIGVPLTAFAIALEAVASLWWLYNDLQDWIETDARNRKTYEERAEERRFDEMARDIGRRIGKM